MTTGNDRPPLIETRQLSRRYGRLLALADLTVRLPAGQITGLVGPNGAGKTTSMRLLLGLVRPTAGHISIDGQPFSGGPDAFPWRVGAMIERPAFYGVLTARETVAFLAGLRRELPAGEVERVLGIVGLTDAAGRRVAGFSTGMLQRLALAVALAGQPPLLILDEPTAGLDPQFGRVVRSVLLDLGAQGRTTVLVSSHLLSEVEQVAQHLVVMRDGRAVRQGPLDDLLTALGPRRTRIRARPVETLADACAALAPGADLERVPDGIVVALDGQKVPDLIAGLVDHGFRIHEVQALRPSLEDLYVEAMEAARDGASSGSAAPGGGPPGPAAPDAGARAGDGTRSPAP